MGSITGSAKAPSQPSKSKIVYLPAENLPETASQPSQQEFQQQRAEAILKRSRSRLGTVLTGFRGALTQTELAVPRKTLLGE